MSTKPISAARLAANRANATRSTGPKSAQGKSRSASNAVKHGLLAETHFEAPASVQSTLAAFIAQFAPVTPLEHSLVARLASLDSRLHRITEIEGGLFEENLARVLPIYPELASEDSRHLGAAYDCASKTLNLLSFYEARLSRDFHRTLTELRHTQQLRIAQTLDDCSVPQESDKQTQAQPQASCTEEVPGITTAPEEAVRTGSASAKTEDPTSFLSQSGPLPSQPVNEAYFLALPPSPSV